MGNTKNPKKRLISCLEVRNGSQPELNKSFQLKFTSLKIMNLAALLIAAILYSCSSKENDPLLDLELRKYEIRCDKAQLDSIYANYEEDIYIPVQISFNGVKKEAKMRLRGDTSREKPKKSLKVVFEDKGFNGDSKKLNLNAEYSDLTYMRQFLSSYLIRKSGNICFESNFAEVYLNGEFYGLYLEVENMDKHFLERNGLSNKAGKLYKATVDGACLSIHDHVPSKWEKKSFKKWGNEDLHQLIEMIDETPVPEFRNFLQEKFHYNALVDLLALNMLLGNGSTYYHNYYLYHDLYSDGKWQMFPWDLDKTLSYYQNYPYKYHVTSTVWISDNALVEKCFLNKEVFNDIKIRVEELHKVLLNDQKLSDLLDRVKPIIADAVSKDQSDKIESTEVWESAIEDEKDYFSTQLALLRSEFDQQPQPFLVERIDRIVTDRPEFKWHPSSHPASKEITYTFIYGPDYTLLDTNTTRTISGIKDTTFTLEEALSDGKYYWRVLADDGTHSIVGFNSRNEITVKKGTALPERLESRLVLTKESSPYTLAGEMVIGRNGILEIEAGTEIHMAGDARIVCHGDILARGNEEMPIYFVPGNNYQAWNDIYFYTDATADFSHTYFEDGLIRSKYANIKMDHCSVKLEQRSMWNESKEGEDKREAMFYAQGGTITADHCEFISNGTGEGLIFYNLEAHVSHSNFRNIPDALEYIQCNNSSMIGNLITGSPDDAIDLDGSNNVLIESNVLIANKDKGISIGDEDFGPCKDNVVVRNNFIAQNHTGLAVKDSSKALVEGNSFVQNSKGIHIYLKRDDHQQGGTVELINGLFYGISEENVLVDEHSELIFGSAAIHEGNLDGALKYEQDPFINLGKGDYLRKDETPTAEFGAFTNVSETIDLSAIRLDDSEEYYLGDWVELKNNTGFDIDLGNGTFSIQTTSEVHTITIPLGVTLKGNSSLFITDKYLDVQWIYPDRQQIGALKKLPRDEFRAELRHASGILIGELEYEP